MAIKKTSLRFTIILLAMTATIFFVNNSNASNLDDQQRRLNSFLLSIRCLTCGGESLATSASPFASNLREVIETQFSAGKSTEQVQDYLRLRYGESIFFRPPFRASTVFLWLSPIVFFLIGFLLVRSSMRMKDGRAMKPRKLVKRPTMKTKRGRAVKRRKK